MLRIGELFLIENSSIFIYFSDLLFYKHDLAYQVFDLYSFASEEIPMNSLSILLTFQESMKCGRQFVNVLKSKVEAARSTLDKKY